MRFLIFSLLSIIAALQLSAMPDDTAGPKPVAAGEPHHLLLAPSVSLTNSAGKITLFYGNPNHKVRLKADKLLKAATTHAPEQATKKDQ